jgi:predicted dehydrogenase
MQPIKVGLIGVGFHARTVHIPALGLVPELRLTALATSSEHTAQEAAARYRVEGYGDYRRLLERSDIEAVIVATPGRLLESVCHDALQSGKHVLLETPSVTDPARGHELQQLAQERNLWVQTAFLTRYSQAFDILKQHLEETPPPRLFTYEYFPFLGHTYNLALYFSGSLERVVGVTQSGAGSTALLQFRNGDSATISGRSIVNCSVDIESVRVSTPTFYGAVEGRRRVRIIRDMQPTGVDAWSVTTSGAQTYEPQPFAGRFLEITGAAPQLRGFAAAIREGTPPRSTLQDAIETCELAQMIGAAG